MSIIRLRGCNDDIQAANEAASLVLTRENVTAYLRFFTLFMRNSKDDNFEIIECLDGVRLVNGDGSEQPPPDNMRLVCIGEDPQTGALTCRGFMAYRGRMFSFAMIVNKGGEVDMVDEGFLGFLVRLNS